jgi:tetratricopeptide (TPR) repeat protein
LPKETQGEQPVQLALTDCMVSRRDWPAVERYLKNKVWEDFEFTRFAILARAAREQGDSPRARDYWGSALRVAARRPESIFTVARVTKDWGWEPEMLEALWIIARSPYNPKWALNALTRHYQAKGDSQGLYRVAIRMVELEPNNDLARNNVAQLSLLLKIGESMAHQEAQKLYQKEPTNPVFASTYAFSQLIQGKAESGVKALQALPVARLNEPEMAAYYGMLLSAQGDKATARKYLALAKNTQLLPEERVFFTKAIAASK